MWCLGWVFSFFFLFWFEWITNRSSLFWGGLTRELPQTDCQKLTLSDSGPKSGVRSEGLQSEADRPRRVSSLTADQRWVGGQSVQLVGMRRAQNAAERRDHMPLTGRVADMHLSSLTLISAGRSSHRDTLIGARGYMIHRPARGVTHMIPTYTQTPTHAFTRTNTDKCIEITIYKHNYKSVCLYDPLHTHIILRN